MYTLKKYKMLVRKTIKTKNRNRCRKQKMISNSDYKIFQNLTSSLNRRNIICTHTFRNIKC
jgi:hypothetical protein